MTEPRHVIIAGDWHGNLDWARHVIAAVPTLLPDEEEPLVLHLGDFGLWPGRSGQDYLDGVGRALARVGAQLWFVHGNHDDHDRLDRLHTGPRLTQIRQRIFWLPVDTRWSWHGKTWVAVGGAASVDKAIRLAYSWPWWPGEALTLEEAELVMASGPADVMVTHEAPAKILIPYGPPSAGWAVEDLARSAAQRELLQRVVDAVRPTLLLHGHHHLSQFQIAPMHYGPMGALSLAADGDPGNVLVLDVETLDFELSDALV